MLALLEYKISHICFKCVLHPYQNLSKPTYLSEKLHTENYLKDDCTYCTYFLCVECNNKRKCSLFLVRIFACIFQWCIIYKL